MFVSEKYAGTREEQYTVVKSQLRTLLEGETNQVANLANAAALLNQFLEQINWVGFYLYEDGELVLGPFQGLPACIRIPMGRGVCGTAAMQRNTVLVDDVEQFPGHIACDAASRSEIVVPLIKDDELLGVLDIDSPITSRFDELDREQLEQFVEELVRHL
ncbi:GAF domain-containing protein [Paenibacillus fonticola]|uniref:GAF domain-containing protein n=1 Tax=Paenibacillus fonticola TaxID=379896 RepID=UPI00035E0E89|nr:GAF domain-containing protein [Paenibacillus fonticola]